MCFFFFEGRSPEEEQLELKMDEEKKEEADDQLIILTLQGISMPKENRPKEDTQEEGQQMETREQETPRPNTPSMFHYDELIGFLTFKRKFFEPQLEQKEITSKIGITLTPKDPLSLLDKMEMTSKEIATHMQEEEEKNVAIQREIERAKEEGWLLFKIKKKKITPKPWLPQD